jgi:hypothetical protein
MKDYKLQAFTDHNKVITSLLLWFNEHAKDLDREELLDALNVIANEIEKIKNETSS